MWTSTIDRRWAEVFFTLLLPSVMYAIFTSPFDPLAIEPHRLGFNTCWIHSSSPRMPRNTSSKKQRSRRSSTRLASGDHVSTVVQPAPSGYLTGPGEEAAPEMTFVRGQSQKAESDRNTHDTAKNSSRGVQHKRQRFDYRYWGRCSCGAGRGGGASYNSGTPARRSRAPGTCARRLPARSSLS